MSGARIRPRPWVDTIPTYRAGRHASNQHGSLASNESGGTSPMASRAVALAAREMHRYPDPLAAPLRERLARLHDIDEASILVGGGSDELMFLLTSAYAAGGGSVVCADPPYWGHEMPARIVGASVTKVALVGYAHDLRAMAEHRADIAFVCNPHNPTGTSVARSELEWFVDHAAARLVVVDEAYVEFADDPAGASVVDLAVDGRVVTLRTMSKFYGLASARVGYLVGPTQVVETLVRIRQPFSVNGLGQAAALAALDDLEHQGSIRERTIANREAITASFRRAGFRVVDSQANFVLVLTDDEAGLLADLEASGVIARPGSDLGLPGSVRVTVPTDAGLTLVERALAPRFRGRGEAMSS